MSYLLMLFGMLFSFSLGATEDFDRQQILQRIQPVGSVTVEGQTKALEDQNTSPTLPAVEKKLTGEEIYERHCIICHKDGVAGAPKIGNADDWKPRLASLHLEGLVATAVKGLNAMPPKGTCGECTEDDLKNAIQFMLPKS